MDPLSEKYYSISPYVYVMNNPMKFVDPTGMVIDSLSQGSWNDQKGIITALRDLLIDKNKNGKNDERITSLNSTLNDMTSLENSDDVYSLAATNGILGILNMMFLLVNLSLNIMVHQILFMNLLMEGNLKGESLALINNQGLL